MIPQHEFLCDANRDLIVDYVGRFESVAEDFATAVEPLGIETPVLPHVNKLRRIARFQDRVRAFVLRGGRQRKHYCDYYDDETREVVADRFGRDIELFGYSF